MKRSRSNAYLLQEQKRLQALRLLQERTEVEEAELRLKEQNMLNKRKLLENIAAEENLKVEEMKRIQREKEEERGRLFSKMTQAEKQTDLLINELMASSTRYSDPNKVGYTYVHCTSSFFLFPWPDT